uniref:G-protein coupled receptors family 1 profile domain-containing protein n=1 Tax=Trichogramma kaykai TaxID=54128 RepID=A0ABD2XJ58_9HYME
MTDQLLSSSWAMRRNISIGAGQDTSMDPDMSRFPKPLRNVAATVSIVIMIVGVIGNLLTIVALLKYPKVRNVAAAFIVSLCVADFVFCSLVLPFDSMRFIDVSWAHVSFLCSLVPFLRYGNTGVSLLFVGAITINRSIRLRSESGDVLHSAGRERPIAQNFPVRHRLLHTLHRYRRLLRQNILGRAQIGEANEAAHAAPADAASARDAADQIAVLARPPGEHPARD